MVDNPLYQRAMFTGAPQAAPQPSVGTGITSGLVDQPVLNVTQQGGFTPQSMPQGTPADAEQGQMAMMSATGLESMASGLQEMFDEIDEAEDVETMINTVRGDEKSIASRYEELAELVGEADAKKTPESVLAVLQPTFQIMETLSGDMPEGGLASIMASEEPEATVRSPGAEEAAMRMLGGEQPVRRFHGSPHTGENLFTPILAQNPMMSPVPVDPNSFQAAMQRRQAQMNPVGPMSPALSEEYMALPQLDLNTPTQGYEFLSNQVEPELIDPANAKQYIDTFDQYLSKYLPTKRSPQDLQSQYQELLKPYMREPQSREELLTQAQDFFGADDQKNMELQAFLALAKAGGTVANTPGSLLQALTAGGATLAGDLAPIASSKAASDRALKEFAFKESMRQEDELDGQMLKMTQDAINQSNIDQNDWNTARRQLGEKALTAALVQNKPT